MKEILSYLFRGIRIIYNDKLQIKRTIFNIYILWNYFFLLTILKRSYVNTANVSFVHLREYYV